MQFKQFYLACLAHASYLVGDDGECAIVDPQRDVDHYLDEAEALGLTIRHVIETHLHADFVSGHVELARVTGATIHVGARAGAAYEHHAVRDGDEIHMGSVTLRFLETPGHTPESVCVLVYDSSVSDKPLKLLTGDTLFIGDVGRPDLVGSKGFTARDMAGLMHDSLRGKLMTLPDEVEVFPAHGAGSACGKNISSALSSTLGEQKATNHALQPMSREQFMELMTSNLTPPPRYFPHSAEMNRQGAPALEDLPTPVSVNPSDLMVRVHDGALALDVRDRVAFGTGHVPGSVNIGLDGQFASWVGTLIDSKKSLILVADSEGDVREAIVRLARVGYHRVAGQLAGGLAAWSNDGRPLGELPQLEVDSLNERLASGEHTGLVLDVRSAGEHRGGHVPGALNIPLPELEARVSELDPEQPTAVICAGGYRSSAAASLLARRGFRRLENVSGGTNAWVQAGHPTESPEAVTS